MSKRIRMCLRLEKTSFTYPKNFVLVDEVSLEAIAEAMMNAYEDSIDYEGESLDETLVELENVVSGYYGEFISEASFVIMEEEQVQACVLICLYRDEPTITYNFTRKSAQRMGYQTLLIGRAAEILYEKGYHSLYLYVNLDNKGAHRLYESLNFKEVPLTTVTEIFID